ncbi:MAG: hypothetical protein AAF456_05685 [Planctomycetota bacterium]
MNSDSRNSGTPFPLRINSIEKFHLFDDADSFPNNLFCRFVFDGKADRDHAIEAIRFFEDRHPMARAVVEPFDGSIPRKWIEARTDQLPSSTIIWEQGRPAQPPFDFSPEPLDLTRQCGLQIFVRQFENRTEAMVQVHHAVFDGGGGIQVINDWLTAYNNLNNGRPADAGAKKLDPGQLIRRNHLGVFSRAYLRHIYKQPIALFGAIKFLFRSFVRLGNRNVDSRSRKLRPAEITGRWLPPESLSKLRSEAERLGVHLNSILLARLFYSVEAFRSGGDDQWIRVILPMSIREVADRRLSAANRSAVVQIDRRQSNFSDKDAFVQYLNREVGIIRLWQFSKLFLMVIRMMSVFPGWLKRSARNPDSRGSLIFTNLGNPFSRNRNLHTREQRTGDEIVDTEVGNLVLREFDLSGPVKPGTPVNFTVQEHGPRLRITMHYDSREISESDAMRLFDVYETSLNDD